MSKPLFLVVAAALAATAEFGLVMAQPAPSQAQEPREPVQTPGQPVQAPGQPVQAPGQPVQTPRQPVQTPREPVQAPGQPVQTSNMRAEDPGESAQASEGESAAKALAEKTTLELYGFVMTDVGVAFGDVSDPDWFDVLRPTKLPTVDGEFGEGPRAFLGVRQTRFGVKTSTPTGFGDLDTIFEWELFGVGEDAGQTTLRLRHAYGSIGQFGAAASRVT